MIVCLTRVSSGFVKSFSADIRTMRESCISLGPIFCLDGRGIVIIRTTFHTMDPSGDGRLGEGRGKNMM